MLWNLNVLVEFWRAICLLLLCRLSFSGAAFGVPGGNVLEFVLECNDEALLCLLQMIFYIFT